MTKAFAQPDTSGLEQAFDGATLKVGRAKRHINELEAIIESFWIGDSEALTATRDADGRYILRFPDLGEQGRQIPIILGDAIHNLRVAFDHVWTALDRAAPAKNSKFPTFPFHETRHNVIDWIDKSPVKRAFPQVKSLILDHIKPYSDAGGDHVLWSLTKLDKLDKHNILIPTIEVRKVGHVVVKSAGTTMTFTNCDIANVAALVSSDTPAEYYCYGEITIDPVFPDRLPVGGERVMQTLIYLAQATDSAIQRMRKAIL
jgi:hypothetical protein